MDNYYINKGIKLFNQLPTEIKQMYTENINKFKLAIKNIYMRSFNSHYYKFYVDLYCYTCSV